ncbi:MAG: sugar phosphate isomerase/epimerase [Oscillospiraceae bacterium]|nr:sugar phosphate isomerase/epimerase [Oscillospiraceae bacterium]
MKLGIIKDWNEESFAYASKKGLDFLEFCVNDDGAAADFLPKTEDIKKWAAQYKIPAGSLGRWSGMRICPDGSINEAAKQSDLALIGAAAKIGCPVFNCGVNYVNSKSFDENIDTAAAYLAELVQYGQQKGVKVAVYNCSWDNFVTSPEAWSKILPRVEGLGIKYDPSHAAEGNRDYLAELRDFGKYVRHVHIKGVVKIDGHVYDNAPAGLDMIQWGAVMDMLYTNRYTGGLSIEPHSGYWTGRRGEWGIDYTIKYMRPLLMPDELDEVWN